MFPVRLYLQKIKKMLPISAMQGGLFHCCPALMAGFAEKIAREIKNEGVVSGPHFDDKML